MDSGVELQETHLFRDKGFGRRQEVVVVFSVEEWLR
jgi:hypothetical protein